MPSSRAVSNVIGYVMIFAIGLIAVGGLYMTGFDIVQSAETEYQMQSAEAGMEIITHHLQTLASGDTTRVTTAIAPGSREQVIINNQSQVTIAVDGEIAAVTSGSITYQSAESDRTTVIDGLLLGYSGTPQPYVLRSPIIHSSQHGVFITTAQLTMPSRPLSITTDNRLLIESADRSLHTYAHEHHTVTIDYSDSQHPRLWQEYFEQHSRWTVSPDASQAATTVTGPVTVQRTVIQIRKALES